MRFDRQQEINVHGKDIFHLQLIYWLRLSRVLSRLSGFTLMTFKNIKQIQIIYPYFHYFSLDPCIIVIIILKNSYIIVACSVYIIILFKILMNSGQYTRNSLSRDKIVTKRSYPQIPFNNQQKTLFSQENKTFQSKKQSLKSKKSTTKQPEYSPEIKRKGSHISNLHQQYNNLRQQMKKFPQRSTKIYEDVHYRGKQRSQHIYMQDDNDRQMRSQSSDQHKFYRKKDGEMKKRDMYSYSQLPQVNMYLEQEYLLKPQNKKKNSTIEEYSYVQKHMKQKDASISSFSANIYLNKMKGSSLSTPPLPNNNRNTQQRQRQDSLIKLDNIQLQSSKQMPRSIRSSSDRPSSIKHKMERFSMCIENNMDSIFDKIEQLQKKHLSLDLYFQQLRQSISYKKSSENENKEVSHAKHRQYKFLIGEYETKLKQVKCQNQRLQRQIVSIKIKQEQYKNQIIENQRKFKQYQKIGENFEKLKDLKDISQRKLVQSQQKINILQKERNKYDQQIQRLKKNIEMMQQSAVKQQHNASQFIQNSTLFGSYDDADYLKQQVAKLQYENKQYQKLIVTKSSEIQSLRRSSQQSKMMMEKIKEMNQQLEKQCSKLQRDIVQKQLQATEKICSLNNNIKKKLKQYDNFKDLVVDCLDQTYKKAPKKIRKAFDSQIINKNRTNKCQIMFKCLNNVLSYYEQQFSIMSERFLKDFSISPLELQKMGLQQSFKKIKQDSISSIKSIESLKTQNKNLQAQISKLKQQMILKIQQQNELLMKQQEEQNIIVKKLKLQSIKKDIPTNDIEPRQSSGSIPEITKKKAQIQKLNKQNNRLIQESHRKYLNYQEQIAQLQVKQKQLKYKIQQIQSQRNDLITKLGEKDNQIKNIQKVVSDLKLQKQGLSLKISQIGNDSKKLNIENQTKINKLSNENQTLKKKIKAWKIEQKQFQKVQLQLKRKTEQIQANLREIKQKQAKISNINEQYRKILDQLNGLRQMRQKQQMINSKNKDYYKIITQITLQRQELKQKYQRAKNINEQYKKLFQKNKKQRQQYQKKSQMQKDKRAKQYQKLSKQLQAKSQELNQLLKLKNQQVIKCKDLQQKLSQSRIQNQELVRLIHKKEDDIDNKQTAINEQKQVIIDLQKKHTLLQKELIQRQQYFKKSEALMQQLLNQNQQYKKELSKKQTEIMELIKQRQELHYRLSEDLDAKSQIFKQSKFKHENEILILKEKLQATEMNLATTKQQLKLKNALVEQLKDVSNSEKKEAVTAKQVREQYQAHLKECRQRMQNLNNKLDILQQQLEQTKTKLNDREQQMNNAKREKNKYYKILQQKADYIDQLEDAVKLKFNEVDQLKEIQQLFEQARQIYEQNEERYKKQIQDLHDSIKQLEERSIETINQLKKDLTIYKQQIDDLKEDLEKQQIKMKIKCKQKEQLNKEIQKKDNDIMNLIKKYEQLKDTKNEQIHERSQDMRRMIQNKESNDQKLKDYTLALQSKEKILTQEIKKLKEQKEQKTHLIQSLNHKIQQIQSKNKTLIEKAKTTISVQPQIQYQLKKRLSDLQHENSQLTYRIISLQTELEQKLMILTNLNNKIEQMDNNVNQLQFKLESAKEENIKLKGEILSPTQERYERSLRDALEQKTKQLDNKEYQIQQLRQENRKIRKNLDNQFQLKLESYKQNYSIIQKQLKTYQEMNIVLTLKYQSLQKQIRDSKQTKDNHFNNNILPQSPSNFDLASIDLGTPEKNNILKHILSQSWHQKRFQIDSKVVDEVIQVRLVKQEVIHTYDEPFQICEQSRYSWPSLDIRENHNQEMMNMMRSQYLQRLQAEINQILVKKEESFGPSFLNLHSNSGIDVLNCIRYQLVEYRNSIDDESIIDELQFVYNHQTDFCEDVQPEIQECLRIVHSQEISIGNSQKMQEYLEALKLSQMRELHKHKEQLLAKQLEKQNLQKQINTVKTQLKLQQNEIQQLIEKNQQEMQQQERYFMSQSQILRKELASQNARADRNQCNFQTFKRTVQKLLEFLTSKEDKQEQLEDAFEHIQKICEQKDTKLRKYIQLFLQNQRQKNKVKKDDSNKKKKGFFGFN